MCHLFLCPNGKKNGENGKKNGENGKKMRILERK